MIAMARRIFKSDAQRRAVMSKIRREKYPHLHRMSLVSMISGVTGVDRCVYDFNDKRMYIYVSHIKDIDRLKVLIPKIVADKQLQGSVDSYEYLLSVRGA